MSGITGATDSGDGAGPSDATLTDALKEMWGDDPPPSAQADFAIAAFSLPRLDEELAELAYDSTSDLALAGVRSAGHSGIHLTFTQGEIAIDVEWQVDEVGELTGQVESPQTPAVTIHRIEGSESIAVDSRGEFRLRNVQRGPIRISCQAGLEHLETDWFRL